MSQIPIIVLIALGALLAAVGVAAAVLRRCYQRLPEGQALVIFGMSGRRVRLDGCGLVMPVVERAEAVDLTQKTVVIERRGPDGLVCKDSIRADIRLAFYVFVEPTAEDVLEVAGRVGCARAGELKTLEELFTARFSEEAKAAASKYTFKEIFAERVRFRDEVMAGVGRDLQGYVLGSVAIDHLARTPVEELDPSNPIDAAGIAKIRGGG